ncbi:hypothetical protein ZOSMA_12G00160 [Zostera marina]|uniref:C2H2-type domain-containing protein n=1 Tax=Zostera marina TaxID=29655 RepID=A0A0K9Q1D3_ZOSMR|nr:hypothetical protein ZOSMA_12G00160 [Zostera marina]
MEKNRYWSSMPSMWAGRKFSTGMPQIYPFPSTSTAAVASNYDSWEEQAFAEDSAGGLGGCVWPPRSYSCSFCGREFKSAQALGGHMNVHRRDRARLKQSSPPPSPLPPPQPPTITTTTATFHDHKRNHYRRPFHRLYSSQVRQQVGNPNPNPNLMLATNKHQLENSKEKMITSNSTTTTATTNSTNHLSFSLQYLRTAAPQITKPPSTIFGWKLGGDPELKRKRSDEEEESTVNDDQKRQRTTTSSTTSIYNNIIPGSTAHVSEGTGLLSFLDPEIHPNHDHEEQDPDEPELDLELRLGNHPVAAENCSEVLA